MLILTTLLIAAVIAVRTLDSVGFNPRIAAAAVAVFMADLLFSWIIVARAKAARHGYESKR